MKSVLFIYAIAVTTVACTTEAEEPATSEVESKLWGLDCSDPGWGWDVEQDIVDYAFDIDFGCNDDPFGTPWGGGAGGGFDNGGGAFCPTQQKTGQGAGSSETTEADARSQARASAFQSARNQCISSFYFPTFPSYCEGGYEQGFSITDSCLQPYPDLYPTYWQCSATASVTCAGYTWHAW